MQQHLKVGDRVKMTRRPFFQGVVVAIQLQLPADGAWGGNTCASGILRAAAVGLRRHRLLGLT
jgi:hypothetical protein